MIGKYLLLALLATAAFAQDPVSITPYQLIDARAGNAIACSNCSIYTYAAGTNTPLATYTSSTLATPNTNPVLTNSAGYAVNGATVTGIWVGSSCYKFVAKDSSAVTLFTQDNICDRGAVLKALLATSAGAGLIGYKHSGSSTTQTVEFKLNQTNNIKDFGAVGDYSFSSGTGTDNCAALNAAAANGGMVYVPGGYYYSSCKWTILAATPVTIQGTGGINDPNSPPAATTGKSVIIFAAGVAGVDFVQGNRYSAIDGMYLYSKSTALGATQSGITAQDSSIRITNNVVYGFGEDGIHLADTFETDQMFVVNNYVWKNFKHGISCANNICNITAVQNNHAVINGQYGFYLTGGSGNVYSGNYASNNTVGDYYIGSIGNTLINNVCEGGPPGGSMILVGTYLTVFMPAVGNCLIENVPSTNGLVNKIYDAAYRETKVSIIPAPTDVNVQCNSTGGPVTYACTAYPSVASYTTGMEIRWNANVSATPGAVTINVSGLGAKSVKLADGTTNPIAGSIVIGQNRRLVYDGTVFRILQPEYSFGVGSNDTVVTFKDETNNVAIWDYSALTGKFTLKTGLIFDVPLKISQIGSNPALELFKNDNTGASAISSILNFSALTGAGPTEGIYASIRSAIFDNTPGAQRGLLHLYTAQGSGTPTIGVTITGYGAVIIPALAGGGATGACIANNGEIYRAPC
tara:strand:+ start:567 stop:2636 length:2070 start_codon:yes stop_codon:yes gene_type:complete